MNSLEQKILEKIQKEGPIPFETFMDMALYYPDVGYYANPETTIGRKGDFYTSPHLHPAFGAMIAKTLMEMWTIMGKPDTFHAVEMGAGLGYLCKDISDYLINASSVKAAAKEKSDFFKSLKYVIVEPFAHFEMKQREVTGKFAKDIIWVKELNEDIAGCIFSNELPDAFPVHLIEMEDELKEIYVAHDGEQFTEIKKAVSSPAVSEYLRNFDVTLPPGYRTEINLRIKDWLTGIEAILRTGFLLTIDYGFSSGEYYNEERSKGTLLCYHEHQFNEDPYRLVGMQDMTAHVNFSSLKKWGEKLGLKTTGYCPQGTFLTSAGIDEVITELFSGSPDYLLEVAGIKGLLFPQGLGVSHNVIIQYKGEGRPELRGFSMRNNADRL